MKFKLSRGNDLEKSKTSTSLLSRTSSGNQEEGHPCFVAHMNNRLQRAARTVMNQ